MVQNVDKKYSRLLDYLPDGFAYLQVVTDSKGDPVDFIFLDVNPCFEELVRLAKNQLIGKKATQIFSGKDAVNPEWIETIGKMALNGESARFEHYSPFLERWFEVVVYSEQPGYFVGIFRDISRYKKNNQIIQENEARLRLISDMAPAGLIIFNSDEQILYLNQKFEKLFGYTLEEISSIQDWWKLAYTDETLRNQIYQDWKEKVREAVGKNQEAEPVVYPVTCKDGTVRQVEFHVGTTGSVNIAVLIDVTERTLMEEKLRENKEKYRTLVENARELIFVVKEYKIVYANPTATQVLGYTQQKLNSRSFLGFVHPEDQENIRKEYIYILKGKTYNSPLAVRAYAQDGTLRWLEFTGVRIEWNNQPAVLAFAKNITLRKQMAYALKESENRYRLLVESAGEGIVVAQDNYFVFANPKACQILECTPEKLRHTPYTSFLHPKDLDRVITEYDQLIKRDKVEQKNVIRLCINNSIKWIEFNSIVIKWDYRPAYLVFFRDITEKKQAEIKLQKSEKRAQRQREAIGEIALDEAFSEGNIPVALQQITQVASKAMEVEQASIWAFSDDHSELQCRSIYEVSKDTHSQGQVLKVASYPRYFNVICSEKRVYASNAQSDPRTSELTEDYLMPQGITSILDAGILSEGKLVGLVSLEHKRHIREWNRDEETFADLIASMVAQLFANAKRKQAEENLEAANKKLKETDRKRNKFLGSLSHELRNPLATITMALPLLDQNAHGENQANKAREIIERQTAQLNRLVEDLLENTRITQNKIVLQKQTLELNQTARKAVEDYQDIFQEHGIKLIFVPASTSLYTKADPIRLLQVLGNLLHNAYKFTESGGFTRVSLTSDDTQQWAEINVADNGTGISPDFLPHIFDPFTQGDLSSSDLGMGLALVKNLVKLHGGSIIACSEGKGKGATFKIKLPL